MLSQEVGTTNETAKIILSAVATAVIGGSGICGIVFLFIKHYIQHKLDDRDKEEQKQRELQKRRRTINDRIQHATGRTLFWIVKAIETGEHNGDLRSSFEQLQKAEDDAKDLDREILAEHDEV